jgi:hypothetical protein
LNGDSRSCFASLLGEQSANYLEASPLAVDFGAAFPLVNAGVYTVLQNSVGIAPVGPTLPKGWSANYTWTLRVEAVPVPGSLPLIVTTLLVMSTRWRREPAP